MLIQINGNNEIVAFATVGSLNGGIEVIDIPVNFIETFKPNKYKYIDEQIIVNENYTEEGQKQPIIPPTSNVPDVDEELRNMFASMQVQLVQANMMVLKLSEQNAKISQEIEKLKGASEDGNVIPEV